MASDSCPGTAERTEAHSHCDHSRADRCAPACPDLHPELSSTRKRHQGFLTPPWAGHQPRFCQDAGGEFRGGQETGGVGEAVYRVLNERLQALEALGASEGTYRAERKKLKAETDAQLEPLWQRVYRVQEQSHRESSKHERYCREQRDLLRALEDLAASERVMHELDAPFGSDYDGLQGGTGESGHVGAGPLLSLYLCSCHEGLACCPFFACQGVYNAGGRWFRWNYDLSTTVN
jgi:hypothetical protein